MINIKKYINHICSWIILTIGIIFVAAALEFLLVPNHIIDGGITGISIILNHITKIKLSKLIFIINIPFLILGYKQLGKKFIIKAVYSMLVFSTCLSYFESLNKEFTSDVVLATVFGGIILGVGIGTVINRGACLDGSEIIAIILNKKIQLSTGQIILIFNIIIFSLAGFLFGWDRSMYSLLAYFISSKLLDLIADGMKEIKSVMIITDKQQDIANNIYRQLGRTCTFVEGTGMISGDKTIIYCVVTRMEISEIKEIIKETDYSAFVTISDVSEIIGEHIKQSKK